MLNRDEVIAAYAERVVEGMDMGDMYTFVYETLVERLECYPDEDLETEVRDFYPDLLEPTDA